MSGIEIAGRHVSCRLIIFDKDGTLIDFTATWVPLIRKRVEMLLKALKMGKDLEASLLKAWGIDPESGRVDPRGPCPVSPRSDEIIIGTMTLYQQGYPWDEAKGLVSRAFDEADAVTNRKEMLKPVAGIQNLLTGLRVKGFLLALATSDERRDTEAMLCSLDMEGLFDVVLCAEEMKPPKPHPESILTICRKVSVPPQEAIFIGDTVTDMMMGKRAGVGLTVGILEGGVTPREELEKVADVVLESIHHLKFF